MTYDRARLGDEGRPSSGGAGAHRARPVPIGAGELPRRDGPRRTVRDGGGPATRPVDSRLRIAGVGLAAAGLLMVICSFLNWTSATGDDLSIAVTGMGSVSVEASETRAQSLGGSAETAAGLDERSKSPGIVTVALGALLIASALTLLLNRHPGPGAAAGAVLALIAVYMSLQYLLTPGAAVLDGTGDTGIGYAAIGLWLVSAGAAVAVLVSGFALVVSLRGKKPPTVEKRPDPVAGSARRQPYTPERARPVATEPRYREHRAPEPTGRPHHGPRPEPGYRARSGPPVDRMGRRPQPPPGYQPRPVQPPRQRPNPPAAHDGWAPPNPGRRPPVRRPPPTPREAPPDRH